MTRRERLQQLGAAGLIVLVTTALLVAAIVRWVATVTLFHDGTAESASHYAFLAAHPVNEGCPGGGSGDRRDLTIHFVPLLPLTHFDGLVEVQDAKRATVYYRGAYTSAITLRGLCRDPAGDGPDLRLALITEHHRYDFEGPGRLPRGPYAEAEVLIRRDPHDVFRQALLRPVR